MSFPLSSSSDHRLASSYQAVVTALAEAQSVCIITHIRPDADAIGSANALRFGLEQKGLRTRVVIGQTAAVSPNLLSIPGGDDVERVHTVGEEPWDLYVTVDCGSLDRTGALAEELEGIGKRGALLCIDHHDSNPGFGTVNLVDSASESTTVIVSHILQVLEVELTETIAHCLYAGLASDTGNFRWGRPLMHEMAARWLAAGVDPTAVSEQLFDTTTVGDLQMIGQVLSTLRVEQMGSLRVAMLFARAEMTDGAAESAVESLVDYVRVLDGTDVGVVFKEKSPQVWAVSLRSTRVNCAKVALSLGGGGHVPAAGYTTRGHDEEIVAQLCAALKA